MDHSKVPNDAQWTSMLDELEDLIASLRKHSPTARGRARERAADGYPRNSMPEGSTGGVGGDPTGSLVVAMAGGRYDDETGETTPDNWHGIKDPIANDVRLMIRETTDARNRLRGATAAMTRCLPTTIPDVPREVCVTCGVSKKVATKNGAQPSGWVVGEGRCQGCSSRIKRNGKPAGSVAS